MLNFIVLSLQFMFFLILYISLFYLSFEAISRCSCSIASTLNNTDLVSYAEFKFEF